MLVALAAAFGLLGGGPLAAQEKPPRSPRLTLERLIDPSTRVEVDGKVITLALHALIRFERLSDLFAYIDDQAGRWRFASDAERQKFADGLLARGVGSRIVSMETELPLEVLLTHTQEELARATAALRTADAPLVFKGRHWQLSVATYRDAFTRVRERWRMHLNCWSASSSMAGRVLSNWFLIDEGITLYEATYDSTEHFWQAVKFHPDVTVADLRSLVGQLSSVNWRPWLAAFESDQGFYFANAYAVEFLKVNLRKERLDWFDAQLARAARGEESARRAQQREGRGAGDPVRFTALDEKILWGDLADVLHLVYVFSGRAQAPRTAAIDGMRKALEARHFDAVYLTGYGSGRFPFLSPEFQQLMLEIWKVKYLQMPRFGEVLKSTSGRTLDHFLDDGDSPDIPIPVYVDYLNRIRELALQSAPR